MKTENLTKEQAIDFLKEYAKCGIHLNYPSNPEKSLNKMEECIAVLAASGSVPKEEPKEESEAISVTYASNKLTLEEEKFLDQLILMPHGADFLIAVNKQAEELSSLRDQLRQRDELIKELINSIIGMKEQIQALGYYPESLSNSIDSLIKKSQKL